MSSPAPTSPPATNTTSPPPPTPDAPPPSTPLPPPPSTTPSPPPPDISTPSPPPPDISTPSPPPPNSSTPSSPSTPSISPPPPSSTTTPSPPQLTPSNPGSPANPGGIQPPPPPPLSPSPSVSSGLVAGMTIAGVVVIVVALIITWFCVKKKKRRDVESHYPPPPAPPLAFKDGAYNQQQQQHYWQSNPPPPANHVVGAVPKPKPSPLPGSRPPLSPPVISSSGGSGSNYSGSENSLATAPSGISLGFSQSTFTYEELAMATDGFSDANLLGQGGFGYVHRGVFPNGKEVAVKQLKAGSGQGEREFQAEVEIISRVHHRHLVSLVGYCITGSQRLLVYEFVPNNTLEFHLHGKGKLTMDWSTRLKIALGSAKGLAYLHEDCNPKIIHRDIKAANILLDLKFEAKVADFGLAKLSSDVNTHVSTRVMGTFGYLAPEYAASGKLTEKSDVYSYGVMLLELITGRRPVDATQSFMEDGLLDWARPLLLKATEEGIYDGLVDPKLHDNYNHNEMARMVACAAACVRHSARRRPRMSQVVRALEGDSSLSDLNEGTRPGHSTAYNSYGSSDYDTAQYNEDLKKFRKMALASQEYGAGSEYSEPTSEYGLYPSASSGNVQTTQETGTTTLKRESEGFSRSS